MQKDKKCLLVIDDDDDFCQIFKEKFEHLGYKVLIALDGADGLQKTEEGRPECVLLDIRIPKGEDGLTYFHKLRAFRHDNPQEQERIRKTPVIVLTGAGAAMQQTFELMGISGYLEKPFDLEQLKDKIEHILGAR